MNNGAPPAKLRNLLICFSHLRWDFVYQRPQHLLTRAARTYKVLYFEEPVFTDHAVPALNVQLTDGIRVLTPHLPRTLEAHSINSQLQQLLQSFLAGESYDELIAWYYTPMAIQFTSELHPDLCVYDNMDELSAFRGASPLLLDLEAQLLKQASVVFTGGRSLFEAKKHRHQNIHALPSSIDREHFAQALMHDLSVPADQAPIAGPRIGFFGVIDERMDLDLVGRCAALRRDWQFVMLGPIAKIDAASLPKAANIHWLGQKKYTELPAYLGGWQLGFMPFALNEATRFISPTKTPEFLAAGLRVVSTAVPDVVQPYGQAGLVSIARDAEDFVVKAERLLLTPPDPGCDARVQEFLASNSWDQTWDYMDALIEEAARPVSSRALDSHLGEKTYV